MKEACNMDNCPHDGRIEVQQANLVMILDRLNELKEDMKELKKSVATVAMLEEGHKHHKEAIERAFKVIKELEEKTDEHEQALHQFRGMKAMAVGLWSVLAGGLGVVIIKVFEVIK